MKSIVDIIFAQDYLPIEKLLNEKFYDLEDGFWVKRFNHWFEHNPAFRIDDVRGFCIRSNGEIKGVLFTIPSCLRYRDMDFNAINLSTWYVDQDHRQKSLQLLQKALDVGADIYFSTSIVQAQMRLTEKFEFKKYINSEFIKAKIFIINPINALLYKSFNKAVNNKWISSISLSTFINLQKRSKFTIRKNLEVSHLDFINRCSYEELTNSRSPEAIEWLTKSSFRAIYYFGIYLNSKQVGMLLWKQISEGVNMLECIDYLVDDTYNQDILSDFNSIVAQTVKTINCKIDIVTVPETCGIPQISSINGFSIVRTPFNNKYFLSLSPEITTLIESDKFHFSNQGDMNL